MPGSPSQKRTYRMSIRAETAAATRGRLLAAAWQHFATRPYEDVRLSEIAADAAVTAQTLHAHFGSKDRLLTAAYIWWGEEVIAGRDAAPVGQVREVIENLFDHYETHGAAVLRMLSQEERIPAIRQMTDAGRIYHREWAARVFQPLLQDLQGRSRQRRLTAITVATDLLAWKLLRRDMRLDRPQAEQIVEEMIQTRPTARPRSSASATERPHQST
jgi:AcrR family transcriptional regulator